LLSSLIFVNAECIQRDEFPEHLVRELELLRQQEANELLQRELERNTCKVTYLTGAPLSTR